MIQSVITDQQEEDVEPLKSFNLLKQQIKNMVKKRQGQCLIQQKCHCEYQFSCLNEKISKSNKINFALKILLKNSMLVIEIQMSLKENWEQVKSFGFGKILKLINIYNMKNEFTYQFNQNLKSTIVKIFNPALSAPIKFQILIDKSIDNLFQLVHGILNPLQGKINQAKQKLQYFADMLEILRRRQEKASKLINVVKLTFGKIKQAPLKHQTSQEILKFQRTVTKYKEHLSKKFKKQSKILRCIKQVQVNKDNQWDNKPGCNSFVQKIQLTYKISQQSSINVQTNQQIRLANKLLQSSQGEKCQSKKQSVSQQIIRTSWLVKKKPNVGGERAFEIQKKILMYLRGQKCYSLNSFYTLEIASSENIQYFYSDYCKDRFDKVLSNIKHYLKAFQSLCQGLAFLRWNALSHRDLKPANILLSKNSISKIIDFGSACHNKLFKYDPNKQKQQKRVFNNQLQTTEQYNLTYKKLDESVRSHFTFFEYNNHPFFDVFAFGTLLKKFIDNQSARFEVGDHVWQALKYLADICKQQNPDDRPDPMHFYVFLEQIIKTIQMAQL